MPEVHGDGIKDKEIEENELKEKEQKEIIIEKIKERPLNKRRLVRRTIITVTMAVLFGLVACFTFLVLQPVISNWLYPQEEQPAILFPEDREEMSPEEMLSDTMLAGMQQQENHQDLQEEEEKQEESAGQGEEALSRDQINEILDQIVLDRSNYRELYSALSSYVAELSQYMVTVTGISSEVDWLNNLEENKDQSSGVIVAKTDQRLYILTDYAPIRNADLITVTLYNSTVVEAAVEQYDPVTNLSIVIVEMDGFSNIMKESIKAATLGSSYMRSFLGVPVVALGSPTGVRGSIGYGVITSNPSNLSLVDANYKLLNTDIYGSSRAGGVLFNLSGEVVGIITNDYHNEDMPNTITAYGISDLKRLIEKMSNSNGRQLPHLGVTGVDVTKEAFENFGIPYGLYVTEVELNSPSMMAGIVQGDVIVSIGESAINNSTNYFTALMSLEKDQEVEVKVMRLSQEEYKEMDLTVTVGGVGKEE